MPVLSKEYDSSCPFVFDVFCHLILPCDKGLSDLISSELSIFVILLFTWIDCFTKKIHVTHRITSHTHNLKQTEDTYDNSICHNSKKIDMVIYRIKDGKNTTKSTKHLIEAKKNTKKTH